MISALASTAAIVSREIGICAGRQRLAGILHVPSDPHGLILFVHGSGSSRFSRRNTHVAGELVASGFATLLFDLLTLEEEELDSRNGELRFDIPLLSKRVGAAADWVQDQPSLKMLKLGLFGSSTGAAAALAAAALRDDIAAIVSRGGCPDQAGVFLPRVRSPTLLIVGGHDRDVLDLNREALAQLTCTASLRIIPKATHLFNEPGALSQVASLAEEWFTRYLGIRL